MTILSVAYHLDEYLPEWDPALPQGGETVRVDLPEADQWTRMAHLHGEVARRVEASAGAGNKVTVASGDCMVALGTATGLHRAGVDFSVVWFDAHGDLQTMETSTSGYVGGIPLRVLVGYRPDKAVERLGLPVVPEERALLVGARDLDPPEEEFLRTSAMRTCAVGEVSAGILPEGPLLVHVDLDVVDPAQISGLLYPAPGGATGEALAVAVHRSGATGRIAALSLAGTWKAGTEDTGGRRARLVAELCRGAGGGR
jgi:arginase